MARVLYGVMGNTHGHIARTLAIVQRLPEHEFYFVGGGRVLEQLSRKYPVFEVPVKRTIHKDQRVSIPATLMSIANCLRRLPSVKKNLVTLIKQWQPDLAISDREFYLPHAAQSCGLQCISLDHSHVLTACDYEKPPGQRISWLLARLEDAFFFNKTRQNLIVSFFRLPIKNSQQNELLPPILRPEVGNHSPHVGEHILLYQTSPTFTALIDAARNLNRPVIVYGYWNHAAIEGNLTFKPFDPNGILADLAGCAYAMVNGGHNLICEALAYGKPVLCFPIAGQFEQFLNASQVRALGYGDYSTNRKPAKELFGEFETRLPAYRNNIAHGFIDGTETVIARVRELIKNSWGIRS